MRKSIKRSLILFFSAFALAALVFASVGLTYNKAKADPSVTFEFEEGAYVKLVGDGGMRFRLKMDADTAASVKAGGGDLTFYAIPAQYAGEVVEDDYETLVSENHATKAVVDKDKIYAGKTYDGDADGYYYANCLFDINKVATYRDLSLYAAAVWNGNAVASSVRTMEDVASACALRGGYYDTIKTVYSWLGTESNPIKAANAADYAALTTVLASDGDLYFYLEDVADTNDLLTTYTNGEITQFTITFEMGAGTAISPIAVNYGTPVSALAGISVTPPENYHFVKWQLKTGVDTYIDFVGNEVLTDDVTVKAVYALNEVSIPEGALLVTDYSTSPSPWNNPNYGSGTVGVVNYYEESQGRAGVVAFGTNQGVRAYTQWTAVVPSFDGTGYNKMIVRAKIDTSKCVRAVLDDNDGLSLITAATSNQWGEVEFNLSELGACYLSIATDSAGDCIWIDQIYLIALPTYAISVTGGTANMNNACRGENITLTVDENSIPEGKTFGYWTVNGAQIVGNSFVMPNQAVTVSAVYIASELAIPEGASLVTDYSTSPSPWNNPNYGHGTVGVVNYYAESQGRAGVVAFGTNQGARSYTQWTAVVPSFDGTGYNKMVLRVKIDTSKCVRAVFDDNDGASLITAATSNQWGEVELNLSDVGSCYLTIATDSAGDCIWIDQIYLKYVAPAATLYDAAQITYIHGVGTPAAGTFSDWAKMGATTDGNAYTHSWGQVGTTYVGAKFNLKLGANTSWLFISFGATSRTNASISSGQSGVMLCISAESHKGLLINTSAGFGGITTGYDFSAGGEYLIEVGVLEAGHYYFKVNDVLVQEEYGMETSLPGSYLNIATWDGNTQIKTALS